jgi:hypothetical protein
MDIRKKILKVIMLTLFILSSDHYFVAAQTPDPGLAGTHTVIKAEYDLGDLAYTPPAAAMFPSNMEERGSVHYPSDLTSGPFPVLLWLHGRHETCYDSVTLATSSVWPCTGRKKPIVSYEGYDYAAQTMASHGYIVISISANAINAADGSLSDDGMNARGVLVQHHLDLWNTWNTTSSGPFGSLFVGRLDMQNIGTMGYSRGGEGVIFNAEYNRSLGSPYGIKAVLTLAPTNFHRHVLNGIPLLDIAPYCDGDVNDLEGVHYYDDARYRDTTDEKPKHTILVMGANHNYFNTVWTQGSYIAGGGDDWLYTGAATSAYCGEGAAGTGRLDSVQQKAVYNTYAAAFYRYYIGHETAFAPILNVTDTRPPASSLVDSSKIFVSYHPGRTDRLDVNRIDSSFNLTVNNLGGAVTQTALVSPTICGGGLSMAVCDGGVSSAQKPHRGTTTIKGLGQMKLRWPDTTALYENDIPVANEDFTYIESMIFRVSENFSETTSGPGLDLTVQLIDSAGNISSQAVSDHSNALFFPPGSTATDLPKILFNTVRIPISGYTGVDLSTIRHIRFRFNRSATGAILMSDLALINTACGKFNTAFTDTVTPSGYHATFTNSTVTNLRDSLTWYWNFGDPTTGTNDTSSLQNPTHTYSGSGSYNVCLYAAAYRKNGNICNDTFCTTIVVPATTLVNALASEEITIIPNPAKDHLHITGVDRTAILTLVDLYGRTVLTTTITQPDIDLPQTLANGIYYAIVTTNKGKVFRKILISK